MAQANTSPAQTYKQRVRWYEEHGEMTTSDAQGAVNAEIIQGKFKPVFDPHYPLDSLPPFKTTTSTAHTAGPWRSTYSEPLGYGVEAVDGIQAIALIHTNGIHAAEANARLIAAAPELLEVCKLMETCLSERVRTMDEQKAFQFARIVISKAEGNA